MKRLLLGAFVLFTLTTSASAECRLIERTAEGREILECDEFSEPLPICGSEFDRGNRCVIQRPEDNHRQRHRVSRPTRDNRSTITTPSNPTGSTPFNAGGSWPNRAQEYARGRR